MSAAVTPASKFGWLVKREFWEYRGGFFWAPIVVAGVMLALTFLTILIAETTAHRHGINLNGMHLDELSQRIGEGDLDKIHAALDMGLMGLGVPIAIALYFVTLFYGVGALYNDRADRSVLFWKSLPISDSQTVLAKVAAMGILAPALSVLALIALQLGFLVLMSGYLSFHGVNPLPLWAPTHLVALWIKLVLLVPIYALWALPSIGWLLLCSAFARSKPFLWAVMLPIVLGILVTWAGLMNELSLSSGWFWRNIIGRALLSLFPGSWTSLANLRALVVDVEKTGSLGGVLSFDSFGQMLTSPNFLIGIVAGLAMIAAAIYFRRARTESYA